MDATARLTVWVLHDRLDVPGWVRSAAPGVAVLATPDVSAAVGALDGVNLVVLALSSGAVAVARAARAARPAVPLLIVGDVNDGLDELYAGGPTDHAPPSETIVRAKVSATLRAAPTAAMIDAVPALVSYVDHDLRYVAVNGAYDGSLAGTRERCLGRTLREVLGDAIADVIEPPLRRALAGETVRYEAPLPLSHAGTKWISAAYTPDIGPDGAVRGVVARVDDITERRRMEEGARRSQDDYRSVFELSGVGLGVVGPDGVFTQVNQELCRIAGAAAEDLVGRPALDLAHPDDRARELAQLGAALWGHTDRWTSEMRVIRADGGVTTVEVNGRVHRDGPATRAVIEIRDVSEQRAAAERVRRSEAALRTLLADAPALMGVVELPPDDSDILHVLDNGETERFFGLGAGATVGRWAARDLGVVPEGIQAWTAAYRKAQTDRAPVGFSFWRRQPGEEPRSLYVTVSHVGRGEEGREQFCYTAVDDTEHQRAEAYARFLLGLEKQIRDQADPRAIAEVGARGLAEVLEVEGCSFAEAEPGSADDLARWGPLIDALRAGVPVDLPASPSAPAARCVPFAVDGRLLACMTVRHDAARRWRDAETDLVRGVTSRLWESMGRARAVVALRDREQALREADERKDQFLATLAHELRNPLAPISNALHLWARAAPDRVHLEEIRGMLERQVRQLTRLTDDLLDVSRISRGKIVLRREPVDLAVIVDAALEAVRPLLDAWEHTVVVQRSAERVVVDGDSARLVQVVGNLLNNAAKYSGRGGRVTVRIAREGEDAVVAVRDEGPGIPREMLSAIFDMFTQVDQTLTRSHGGLGIGLTLVRNLVELHGGSVVAHSDGPGTGSEFVIRMPVAAAEPARPARAREAAPGRARVLVVDDIAASADTLALLLRALGQDVRTAYDGPSALDLVERFHPQVVLSDIGMPGMDGYEVARRIRRGPDRPVLVALTGYGQEEDRRRAFDAGFDHHMVKPASMDALQELLLSVV